MAVLLDRLYNFHWVNRAVARAAQPYLGFYAAFLKAHGFKSLINLRGANPGHRWWRGEKALAARLGIGKWVTYPDQYAYDTNLITREQLAAWYRGLDVLSICSYGEGFGLPLIEAQAAGIPDRKSTRLNSSH